MTVPTWDKSVEAYEMLENGTVIGRFYLDMHPRKDKYNHAAEFGIRSGVTGRQIPEASLICNLPGGEAGDPGLMTHDDVETFFHEFGHLVHALVSGRHQWVGISGISTEQDFVEAPSQMLEEWIWDPKTLQTFAKHYETNEPIPTPLVTRMRRASEFGKAMTVRRQMMYARLSLSIYDRDPAKVDTTAMVKEVQNRYTPFQYVEGTHFQLHVHVVARDREGHVQQVRPQRPPRVGGRGEVPQLGARARRIETRGGTGRGLPRPSVRLQGLGELAQSGGVLAAPLQAHN